MRKNIHKKSEARPIKNTPHKTTKNKKITKSKIQTKNSLHCDADEFYLTYIYMFICATTNKKITQTTTTHITANFYHARLRTHFHKHNAWHASITKKHKTNLFASYISFHRHRHSAFPLYYLYFTSPSDHVIPIYYV